MNREIKWLCAGIVGEITRQYAGIFRKITRLYSIHRDFVVKLYEERAICRESQWNCICNLQKCFGKIQGYNLQRFLVKLHSNMQWFSEKLHGHTQGFLVKLYEECAICKDFQWTCMCNMQKCLDKLQGYLQRFSVKLQGNMQ